MIRQSQQTWPCDLLLRFQVLELYTRHIRRAKHTLSIRLDADAGLKVPMKNFQVVMYITYKKLLLMPLYSAS